MKKRSTLRSRRVCLGGCGTHILQQSTDPATLAMPKLCKSCKQRKVQPAPVTPFKVAGAIRRA